MLIRELAFSNDARILAILGDATVLINPAANPDGQAAGRRTNTAHQDLNRDSLMVRHPETFSLAEAIRVMEGSELVAETLGEHVFEFFLRNKRAEWQEYRRQVTPYERDRMLPVL